jgi:hypothetical protein
MCVAQLMPAYGRTLAQLRDSNTQLEVSRSGSSFYRRSSNNGAVTFVSVRPFEAALTVLAADHYLRKKFLPKLLPTERSILSTYLETLPLDLAVSNGTESNFLSVSLDDTRFDLHSCTEQLARNLVDVYVTHADDNIYRLHDATPDVVQSAFLASLYLVLSRVLLLPRPLEDEKSSALRRSLSEEVEAVVPFLDMFNHSPDGDATCKLSVTCGRRLHDRCAVVRTQRPLRYGEELTIEYAPCQTSFCSSSLPTTAMELRYQMSFSTGGDDIGRDDIGLDGLDIPSEDFWDPMEERERERERERDLTEWYFFSLFLFWNSLLKNWEKRTRCRPISIFYSVSVM